MLARKLTSVKSVTHVTANNRGNCSDDDSEDEDYEPEHEDSWKKVGDVSFVAL